MSLLHGLIQSAEKYADNPAVICSGRQLTWRQLYDQVRCLASGLADQGVTSSCRVAILSLNSIEYLQYLFAVPWLGAVMVPLNTRLAVPELAYQLQDSQSEILFFDHHNLSAAEALYLQDTGVRSFVYIGDGDTPYFAVNFHDLLRFAMHPQQALVKGHHALTIMYTGGTTGLPKGVILSHDNMLYNVSCLTRDLGCNQHSRFLQNPPLFHLSGMGPCLALSVLGATTVFLPSFDTEAHLALLSELRCTATSVVPTTLAWMLDCPDINKYSLDALESIIYGSAPITENLLRRSLERFPALKFTQFYGQTEYCGGIALLRPEDHQLCEANKHRLKAAGRITSNTDVAIVDAEGAILAPGAVGEIVARGKSVFQGYLNNPQQTTAALRGGWLHTGDAGYIDHDGYLYVTDRIKDMIVTGGENVASSEPENVIARHPAVAQVAVIGVPSSQWGEQVHAVVVLRSGSDLTEKEVIDFCREHIAGYKCPKSVEIRNSALPLSAIGKVKKDVLRKDYMQEEA